jgi:hypothetical protein
MVAEAIPESAVCEVLNTPEDQSGFGECLLPQRVHVSEGHALGQRAWRNGARLLLRNVQEPWRVRNQSAANGKLARTAKFTFGSDYKIAENGIVKQNNVGTLRILVPAQIIGEQDGQWDRNAYKTDAFFGNPLSGFTWP